MLLAPAVRECPLLGGILELVLRPCREQRKMSLLRRIDLSISPAERFKGSPKAPRDVATPQTQCLVPHTLQNGSTLPLLILQISIAAGPASGEVPRQTRWGRRSASSGAERLGNSSRNCASTYAQARNLSSTKCRCVFAQSTGHTPRLAPGVLNIRRSSIASSISSSGTWLARPSTSARRMYSHTAYLPALSGGTAIEADFFGPMLSGEMSIT